MSPYLRDLGFAVLGVWLAVSIIGCVVIPIPAKGKIVTGHEVAEKDVRSMLCKDQDSLDVKARIGEPIIDFGPGRVFVYMWAIQKGKVVWLAGAGGGGFGGITPIVASSLLFIAFDPDGKVLETGTEEFNSFDTVGKQVYEWLSRSGLASQVDNLRPGDSTSRIPALFVYRPRHSPCAFPRYDANIFKPSVAVDGIVVGDLAKGEYLTSKISAGAHTITIDPVPYYRYLGQETDSFVQSISKNRIPITVHISVEPDQPTYVETYVCTGTGKIEMNAVVRDGPSALKAMNGLQPAW